MGLFNAYKFNSTLKCGQKVSKVKQGCVSYPFCLYATLPNIKGAKGGEILSKIQPVAIPTINAENIVAESINASTNADEQSGNGNDSNIGGNARADCGENDCLCEDFSKNQDCKQCENGEELSKEQNENGEEQSGKQSGQNEEHGGQGGEQADNQEDEEQTSECEESEKRLSVTQNILKTMENSKDLVSREILVCGKKIDLIFLQDLTSYAVISEYIIKPLLRCDDFDAVTGKADKLNSTSSNPYSLIAEACAGGGGALQASVGEKCANGGESGQGDNGQGSQEQSNQSEEDSEEQYGQVGKRQCGDDSNVQCGQGGGKDKEERTSEFIKHLAKDVIQGREVKIMQDVEECIYLILKGKVFLAIEGESQYIIVDATRFNTRAISEPPTSSVLQGPREGFNESIKNNISMVRRRISSPHLVIEDVQVGRQTRTLVSVMYLSNIADDKNAKEIIDRIKAIDIDGIVDSYYLIDFLQKHKDSIFKQVGTTEKPDIVTNKLLEGRIAIFVDGSPIVLTLPFLLYENFQSSEDYYSGHYHSTFIRWLRLIGIGLAVLLPGIYVSLQVFHHGIIPLKFLVTIANSTDGLPFTPLLEVLFILLLFELLNEASLRMPKYLGMAMSIIGALILGDTAVKAGLISPPAVMIIALSSMTIFTVADLSNQLSLLRLGFVFLGGLIGIYGVILGIVFLVGYLNSLDSYGTPFLAPLSPKVNNDLQDFMNMKSTSTMTKRPQSIPNKNATRIKQEDKQGEESND